MHGHLNVKIQDLCIFAKLIAKFKTYQWIFYCWKQLAFQYNLNYSIEFLSTSVCQHLVLRD